MEKELVAELKSGKNISAKIDVSYPASGVRPQKFTVTATIGTGSNRVTQTFIFTQ